MKNILFCASLLCLTGSSTALASPEVTEIRLKDYPGLVAPNPPVNEFVFRADGTFYWVEGRTEKPIRHRYSIDRDEFQKLVAALETHRFFSFKPIYDRLKPTDGLLADGGGTIISVKRAGKTIRVNNYSDFGPPALWELEIILRGFASTYTGLARTPENSSAARPLPTPVPTSTPIPIIRGTTRTPN